MKKNNLFLAFILSISGLFLFSCAEDKKDQAKIRFVNASPDSPAMDFLIDDKLEDSSLVFSQATDYMDIDSGSRRLKLRANLSSRVLIDEVVNIEDGGDYTFVATNLREELEGILYTDKNTDPDKGDIKLRFINSAPSTQRIDVYVSFKGTDISDNNRIPTFEDILFSDVSDYIDLNDEEYQIRITTANTKNIILDTGVIDFPDRAVRTIVILDSEGGGRPLTYLTLADEN